MGAESATEKDLTPKQRLFVAKYLGEARFNASRAARLAGYSLKTAYAIGHANLKKAEIKAAIDAALSEQAMPRSEVLARLADHARGSLEDFISIDPADGRWKLDLPKAEASGKLHLVHEISYTEHGPKVKLYDAQAALTQLGRHHQLFKDGVDVTSGGEPVVGYLIVPPGAKDGDGPGDAHEEQ